MSQPVTHVHRTRSCGEFEANRTGRHYATSTYHITLRLSVHRIVFTIVSERMQGSKRPAGS